jgi:hypothetical protein
MTTTTILGSSVLLLNVSRSRRWPDTLRRTGSSRMPNGYALFGGRNGRKKSVDKGGLD